MADKLLVEDRIVRGVRSGDKGRDREGKELGNFEPGSDLMAKATVLCEGTLGHLTYAALDHYDLRGSDHQRWELGVKEIWEVPEPLTKVIHTMGWPLRKAAKYNEFGGSFIYPMGENKLCIGMVIGLDYTDATVSCHDLLQELKTHPFVTKLLAGGKRVGWGAKTIPSGGYWAMPKKLAVPGMMMCRGRGRDGQHPDAEGRPLRDARRHVRRRDDRRIAEEGPDSVDFSAYEERVRGSLIEKELYQSRNMRQPFEKGFFVGGAIASAMTITKGAFPGGHWDAEADDEHVMSIGKGSTGLPQAGRRAHLRQARLGLPERQRDPRRRAQPRQDPAPRPPRGGADLGLDVPGRGLRDPRGPARERLGHRRRQRRPLQLRPVRRDHRQGRPPDDARGRRRPPLPGGLALPASSPPASAGTSTACSRRASSGTISSARSWVAARTTKAAAPSSWARSQLAAVTHQRSPGFSPGKP